MLRLRYKITGLDPLTGSVVTIMDTTSLPDDSRFVADGGILINARDQYQFIYSGTESLCGQSGHLSVTLINPLQMELILLRDHIMVFAEDNFPDEVEQLFPTKERLVLDKQ